ncbi:MAG: hypothetical protein RR934_05965, partial [Gordonibacter sp.]|uniref:hypothetical protein n=1 Tax=Gordonibacter sp. TaxID=1968902 RepID=UPI00322084B5
MGLPPYGPEPYASANSATPALHLFSKAEASEHDTPVELPWQGSIRGIFCGIFREKQRRQPISTISTASCCIRVGNVQHPVDAVL